MYTIDSLIYPQLPIVADFNNDNQLDIAFTDETITDIVVLLGNGDGTFSSKIRNSILYSDPFENLLSGDMNNDERLDIIFVDTNLQCIGVVLGNGDGTFESESILTCSTLIAYMSSSIIIVDFNNDTYLDMALFDSLEAVHVYTAYGNGSFSLETVLSFGMDVILTSISARDFNNDGYQDFSIVDMYNKNIHLFFGYGNGSFQPFKSVFTGGVLLVTYTSFGDFNNDNLFDVIVLYYTNELRLLLGFANGTFSRQKLIYYYESDDNILISVNDLNKDGNLDIIIGMISPYGIYILYGDGYGNFWSEIAFSMDIQGDLTWGNVADFNNDGYEDILVTEKTSGQMNILLNTNNCNSN